MMNVNERLLLVCFIVGQEQQETMDDGGTSSKNHGTRRRAPVRANRAHGLKENVNDQQHHTASCCFCFLLLLLLLLSHVPCAMCHNNYIGHFKRIKNQSQILNPPHFA